MHRPQEKPPLLVLLGPTACGKTALSLEIAKKFNAEIISADSRQVYKHMDIGTDKIPLEKRQGILHHLIDVVEPSERFTVADFKKLAEEKIDDILKHGKLPLLVGGTGLYIRALVQNFSIPQENPALRQKLVKEWRENGIVELYKKLQKLDPENAGKIHPHNALYIIRALEIFLTSGHPKKAEKKKPRYRSLLIGLSYPTEKLFQRIEKRVDEQIEHDLVEETKKLLAKGFSKNLSSMQSLGYREITEYLEDKISLPKAIELLKKHTRNFAKQQITWFKKEPGIHWIHLS